MINSRLLPRIAGITTLVLGTHANAGLVQSSGVFSTSNQSMWGTGEALTLDFNECLCFDWNETVNSPYVNAGGTFSPSKGRARMSLQSSGRAGVEVDLKFNSGNVNARSAYQARWTTPDATQINQTYSLASTIDVTSSAFDTLFPQLQAYADVVLDATFTGSVNGSAGPRIGDQRNFNRRLFSRTIDPRLELVGFNRDGDGELRILEDLENPLPVQFGEPISFQSNGSEVANVTVHLPDIQTESATVNGRTASSGATDLLEAKLDLDGILTSNLAVFGVPPFEQSFDIARVDLFGGDVTLVPKLSYNLLDIEVGPILKLTQDFELETDLRTSLTFDKAVQIHEYTHVTGIQPGATPGGSYRLENVRVERGNPADLVTTIQLGQLRNAISTCDLGSLGSFEIVPGSGSTSRTTSYSSTPPPPQALTVSIRGFQNRRYSATIPADSGCLRSTTIDRIVEVDRIAAGDFEEKLDFVYTGEQVNVLAQHDLFASFMNDTALAIDFEATIEALSASLGFEIELAGLPDLDFGTLRAGPVYRDGIRSELAELGSIFNRSFALGGFNSVQTQFSLFDGDGIIVVSEPAVTPLMLLGLLSLWTSRRRLRTNNRSRR